MSRVNLGRVLRTGLSSLRDRAAARLAAMRFNPSRVTITRTSTRPMTDADWAHFDAAFKKMDEAFDELGKIK
jgi:hypothetical protein